MRTRRRHTKGALTSIAGALLIGILVVSGTFAAADAPWPQHSPVQDPARYDQYGYSAGLPDDYSPADGDYWKYTGDVSGTPYQALISLVNPELDLRELRGVMGSSVDRAWGVTTGRPEALIALLDSGLDWRDTAAMADLSRKVYLNSGEVPPPQGAFAWDMNGDGMFNMDDYAVDPRVTDLNGNGVLDPEDLIWTFSNGEDDDQNGYVDDICGWDFLEDDNDPWDEYGDGGGTAGALRSAGEADNGAGMPGICPNAMLLPVRVSGSRAADMNDFAQGVVFAVDSGAWVVQGGVAGTNNTPLARDAIDYASSRGVAVIASAGEAGSALQGYPAAYEDAIQVNALQGYIAADTPTKEVFPSSYLYLGGQTGYGAGSVVAVPADGGASEAAAHAAGVAALIYSAAENDVQRGELWRYPGLETPLSAGEVKQLIAMTADDIDFSPAPFNMSLGESLDPIAGLSRRFPSHQGWDPYFGYGRINAYEAVMAVDQGRIPPEASIESPGSYELLNPGQVTLEVTGRVAAVRAESFQYTLEWGPGWDPGEDEWMTISEADTQYEPVDGVLATLDLGEVYRSVMDTMQARGGQGDPNRYAFTLRVRVRDNRGNWGEDRKTAFCFYDPDTYAGMPLYLGSDISASPRFADLDDDGENELIVAGGDGQVRAYNSDLSGVPGWPVHATPLPLHEGSEGFKTGAVAGTAYASIAGTPALGDLDHDGDLEVVAGDTLGRVYAWDKDGELLPGFPVRSNPLYSIPDRADWWTEGALPAEWYASRFVPDRIHALDRWNRLDRAFTGGPVLGNLDSSPDGSLEIIAACADQHLYAWNAAGGVLAGWPVKLVDAGKVASLDPLTHTCEFAGKENVSPVGGTAAAPSIADLDGDGDLEVICGSNEVYLGEGFNVSARTFGLSSFLPALGPYAGEAAGQLNPSNTRVYALHHEGAVHGLEPGAQPAADKVPVQAYLDGWPVKLAVAAPGSQPAVLGGVSGTAAVADVDGDGSMEIGTSSAAGPGMIFKLDGTSFMGGDELGLPLGLRSDEKGAASAFGDLPLMCAWGSGIFATLGGSDTSFIAPVVGLANVIDMYLPGDQARSGAGMAAWNAGSGNMLDAFPAGVNGTVRSLAPGAADIDGDGQQEVLAGSDAGELHAFNAAGVEPAGWPKFTGGCSTVTPAVADFDGDGGREVAAGTREGWLFVWHTASSAGDLADWPQYGHDSWNTGCLESDSTRPGRVLDLAGERITDGEDTLGVKLTWTAPGDDALQGQALCYEIRFLNRPIDETSWQDAVPLTSDKPMPAPAGSVQEYLLQGFPFTTVNPGTVYYFALQVRDEAGNFSAISNLASVTYGEEAVPEAPAP